MAAYSGVLRRAIGAAGGAGRGRECGGPGRVAEYGQTGGVNQY